MVEKPLSNPVPLFVIFISAILCSSCGEQVNEVVYDHFNVERPLEGRKIDWIDCKSGFDMQLYDSILVVTDNGSEDKIHFYNIHTKEKLGFLGKAGKGPGEFIGYVQLHPQHIKESGETLIWIGDSGKRELIQVSLLPSITSGELVIRSTVHIPDLGNPGYFRPLSDSIFIDVSRDEKQSFSYYNIKSESYCKFLTHPNELLAIKFKNALAQTPNGVPNSEKAVGSFGYMQRFHIYDQYGNLDLIVRHKDEPMVSNLTKGPNQVPIRFYGTILSKDHIIIIDENRPIPEITNSTILVFDYQGNTLFKYPLQRMIRGYAMDWETLQFYAFDPGNYEFLKYDLSEIEL